MQPPDWADPGVLSRNQEPAHAAFFAFESCEAALTARKESSARFVSLNKKWKFQWRRSAKALRKENITQLTAASLDDAEWGDIDVPGNWELLGHGFPICAQGDSTSGPGHAPRTLADKGALTEVVDNPVGIYRTTFELPPAFVQARDDCCILHLGAVTSCVYVYVNGKEVGFSKQSKLPAEFNVTPYLAVPTMGSESSGAAAPNSLALVVLCLDDGTVPERNTWFLSGITRDVFLFSRRSSNYVRDIRTRAFLPNTFSGQQNAEGIVDVDLDVESTGTSVKVEIGLFDDEAGGLPALLACTKGLPCYAQTTSSGNAGTPLSSATDGLSDLHLPGSRVFAKEYVMGEEGSVLQTGGRLHTPDQEVVTPEWRDAVGGRDSGLENVTAQVPGLRSHKAGEEIDLASRSGGRYVTTSSTNRQGHQVLNGLELAGARLHAPGQPVDVKTKLANMSAPAWAGGPKKSDKSSGSLQSPSKVSSCSGPVCMPGVQLASLCTVEQTSVASCANARRYGALVQGRVSAKKVKAWSAETPNMYTLMVTVSATTGSQNEGYQVVEVIRLRVGFRSVEVSGGRLRVNGKALTLRGVNWHEHTPDKGHVVSLESMAHDIRLMKEFNFNAVRCSHYPNDERFYQLCDELGMYVIDKANIRSYRPGYKNQESVAGKAGASESLDFASAPLDHMKRMFERDKNFTCIIMWSLCYEAENGPALLRGYSWLKRRDSSRPVQHENVHADQLLSFHDVDCIDETDIYCPMYPTPSQLGAYGKSHLLDPTARPLIMRGYSHAIGSNCGGLADYWAAIKSSTVLQGGFISDFADPGLLLPDTSPKVFGAAGSAMGAHDAGILSVRPPPVFAYPGDCVKGIFEPDRRPKPPAWEAKTAMQPIAFELFPIHSDSAEGVSLGGKNILGKILPMRIQNLHDFISLQSFDCTYEVAIDGIVVSQDVVTIPPCEAGESVLINIHVAKGGLAFGNITSLWSKPEPRLSVATVIAAVGKKLDNVMSRPGAKVDSMLYQKTLSSMDRVLTQGGEKLASALVKHNVVSVPTAELTLPRGVRRAGDATPHPQRPASPSSAAVSPAPESEVSTASKIPQQQASPGSRSPAPKPSTSENGDVNMRSKLAAVARGTVQNDPKTVEGAQPTDPTSCKVQIAVPAEAQTEFVSEAVLTVRCRRLHDLHCVAHAQFVLPALDASPAPEPMPFTALKVDENWEGGVCVRGELDDDHFSVHFSRRTGLPVQMEYGGVKRLLEDQDSGFRLIWWPLTDLKLENPKDGMRLKSPMTVERKIDGSCVSVVGVIELTGSAATATTRCCVLQDGSMTMAIKVDSCSKSTLPAPARVSVTAKWTRSEAQEMIWYGRGPHESHPDRCTVNAPIGVWNTEIAAATSECNRPDTRWLALTSSSNAGKGNNEMRGSLLVSLKGHVQVPEGVACPQALVVPSLSMQCHYFHMNGGQPIEEESTTLSIGRASAGVGTMDSSMPLPQFQIASGAGLIEFAFAILPLLPPRVSSKRDTVKTGATKGSSENGAGYSIRGRRSVSSSATESRPGFTSQRLAGIAVQARSKLISFADVEHEETACAWGQKQDQMSIGTQKASKMNLV